MDSRFLNVVVNGDSMWPTLKQGSTAKFERIDSTSVAVGQVVLLDHPFRPNLRIIKRINLWKMVDYSLSVTIQIRRLVRIVTTLGKLMYPQLSRFLPNNCTIYLKGITKPFGGLRTQINQIIEIKFIAIAR